MNISGINHRPNLYTQNNQKNSNTANNKQNISFSGLSTSSNGVGAIALSTLALTGIVLGIINPKQNIKQDLKPNEGDTITITTKEFTDSTFTHDYAIPTKNGEIHLPVTTIITPTGGKTCYGMPTGKGEIAYSQIISKMPSDTLRGEMDITTKSGNHMKYPFTYTANSGMKLDCIDLKELAKKAAKSL